MRPAAGPIWDAWTPGGPFIGDRAPHGRVTVEKDWWLNVQLSAGSYQKCPIRWFQREDDSQVETEIPNVKSIDIDRSIDTDAASATINVYNQKMLANAIAGSGAAVLGQPGYYTWRFRSSEANARWGPGPGEEWRDVLVPDALLRCVDTETEILTRRGWLRWDDVAIGDETLGINPATGQSEWQVVEEVFSAHHQGEMLRLRTRVHDSLTTLDHRWLTKSRSGNWLWKTSSTLTTNSRIPLAAPHLNTNAPVYSDDFVELAAWYYTEGTAEHRLRSLDWGGGITQSETANRENVVRLRALFTRLYGEPGALPRGKYVPQELVDEAVRLRGQGMTCRAVAQKVGVSEESVRRWGNGQRRRSKQHKWAEAYQGQRPVKVFKFTQEVARPLRIVICGPDKVPSVDFLNALTQSQLELFIEVSVLGDGTNDRGALSFIQSNRQRSDAFEYACALAGVPVHTTREGRKTKTALLACDVVKPVGAYQQKKKTGVRSAISQRVQYDDVVWCPRVEHSNWLARRNGTVYFTGNTYQGYGGLDKTIPEAVADGNLVLAGLWLVDTVKLTSAGMIELRCRDMAKLLIEQHLYPPLVPAALYPHGLRYCRWNFNVHPAVPATPGSAGAGNKRCVYSRVGASEASGSDVWQGGFDRSLHGHFPHEAFDGDDSTFWLSVGNDSAEEPFAVEWIEAACGDEIDTVFVNPWAGNYRCYVSVMVDGAWVDGGLGVIPYDPAAIGRYNDANAAGIPFVAQAAVPMETPTTIALPRSYVADKVRFTFSNLYRSQWGPYPFRAGVRRLGLSLGSQRTGATSGSAAYTTQDDGNYRDFSDIIKDLALWAGFCLHDGTGGDPKVFGNIESTGIADTGSCILEDQFAKKTVIDAMHIIRDIVSYLLRVDEEGGFRFESPNYFKAGNFDMAGAYVPVIPEIDEAMQLTDYSVVYSDAPARTDIIISSDEPTADLANTVTTHLVPEAMPLLRGIVRPLMFINGFLTDPNDQLVMARLIDREIRNALVNGSVGCAANPCIGINDQVKIHERVTSETGIHYITGCRTSMDLDTGSYLMTLTTYRVGDEDGFVVTA